MGQIVVGYDGSDCGNAALDAALELAKGLGDRVVVVFGYAPPGLWGGEIAEHEEAIEELGAKVIGQGAERAAAARHRDRGGMVAEAADRGADRGRRGARRADDRRRQLRRRR